MIGWMIVVSMQTPEERNRSDQETKEATTLAQWEVGPGGIDWIEHLVDVSKAEKLYRGGYPNRYSVRASDILPLLVNKLPSYTGPAIIGDDYVMPSNWRGQITLHPDRIAACPANHMLTIDAWDLS